MGRIKPLKEELYELYINQLKTTVEIAKIYGYKSSQTISNLLNKHNIKIRDYKEAQHNNIIHIETEWLINAYEIENKTITEIANILNCAINTVRRRLIELKIPIKKRYDLSKNNLPHYLGEKNPTWKGGRFQRNDGYICIWNGKKYVLEHRKIMGEYLGRELLLEEQIHHINKCKWDNRVENFEITNVHEHINTHRALGDL
ncbi:MAG: hypothetical protein PHT02_00765 [Tissierellia bacterium]|nr:hypothetical protein [Tissierellia bacterium]